MCAVQQKVQENSVKGHNYDFFFFSFPNLAVVKILLLFMKLNQF